MGQNTMSESSTLCTRYDRSVGRSLGESEPSRKSNVSLVLRVDGHPAPSADAASHRPLVCPSASRRTQIHTLTHTEFTDGDMDIDQDMKTDTDTHTDVDVNRASGTNVDMDMDMDMWI